MGANTKALRNRIKSVDSTLHLTKAMGLVASSKIRRASEAMIKSREYKNAFSDIIARLSASVECEKSPYMKKEGNNTRYIVIAGDRGLAGGYNANVFRMVSELDAKDIVPIGKRACERYGGEILLCEDFSLDNAISLSKKLCEDFVNGEYTRLEIVYTEYISVMTVIPKTISVLPLERSTDNNTSSSIVFEPDEITILDTVIPEYVASMITAAVRESYLSEVASRRMAMDSAGKNAQQMIDDLTLSYNRARQGAITQEITEIVAGGGE